MLDTFHALKCISNKKGELCHLCCSTSPQYYITKLLKTKNPVLVDKQAPPTHWTMKKGYSFSNWDAWGPLFMTRDWGHYNITDSKGQRFLGNQHKDCGTMLQEQTLVISRPLCMSSSDHPGILRATKTVMWQKLKHSKLKCPHDSNTPITLLHYWRCLHLTQRINSITHENFCNKCKRKENHTALHSEVMRLHW